MVSQPDAALAAMLDGASTSADVAGVLGMSVERAASVLRRLRRQGYVRRTARRIPSSTGRGGNPLVVYDVVTR